MGVRWDPIGFQFFCFLVLILALFIRGSVSLNSDGLALLAFRARICSDPYGALANWDPNEHTPCIWLGVHCVNDQVRILDLSALYLEGTLAPELGKLSDLRYLLLSQNHLFGSIPKELGQLKKLKLLDLRDNNLSGTIPKEIGTMLSLRHLLLSNNKFEGNIQGSLGRLNLLIELQLDDHPTFVEVVGGFCVHRKFGSCIRENGLKLLSRAESFFNPIKGAIIHHLNILPVPLFKLSNYSPSEDQQTCNSEKLGSHNARNLLQFVPRRLAEQSKNIEAAFAGDDSSTGSIIALPTFRSSGTFPAVPNAQKKNPSPPAAQLLPSDDSPSYPRFQSPQSFTPTSPGAKNAWKYLIAIPLTAILVAAIALFIICRKRAVKTIRPWKTGISGQLQKAFVTGVPKLNRSELETACEDFSNIVDNHGHSVVYKGTLSSGVEIAVASTAANSLEDWPKSAERLYRKTIDTLSRVNHKNYVNLIGHCEQNDPFTRMMVFEYAPNGKLFEHLHVEEMEHLDWNSRMRIIMGTAYCLQYMHHDLNPPVAHEDLSSMCIFLTEDYAAKLAELSFCVQAPKKSKGSSSDEAEQSELPPTADPESNVHSFGRLLLETISGKLPYSEKGGPIQKWASEYLNDKAKYTNLVDPSLKSFKNAELNVICEVIQECIQQDPRNRPTMKEVVSKLREVINISPDQAIPRLSPLWWAELEILSMEAT